MNQTTYQEIIQKIDQLIIQKKEPLVIAIEGPSGSGKSTLAKKIEGHYKCNLFHMDDFFLPIEAKTPQRLGEIGGNVDYERFNREIIKPLQKQQPFTYQVFNCKQQTLGEKREVVPHQVNIIEGVYSLHSQWREVYDLWIFLNVSPQEQAQRIRKRNGSQMLERYQKEWIPLEKKYFESLILEASETCMLY